MLRQVLLVGVTGLVFSINAWGVNVTVVKAIDPAGADTVSYENPNSWVATTAGQAVGAAKIDKSAFEALPSDKMGVLDFETANGWNQPSLPIRYDQTVIGGRGSPFDGNFNSIAPYVSSDKLTTVSITGMKGSAGENLTVSLDSALRDTQAVIGLGVCLTTDNGNGATGYLVTGGTQGISTPSLYWNGSAQVISGVWVTFSSPMQAAGVCTNMGQPTYGRYPKVMWFDANGNQLAAASSPCNVGNSIFWGIQTDVPAVKSMWIGDAGTFPGNYIIDDIAFCSNVPQIVTAVKTIDPAGADTVSYENPTSWVATAAGQGVGAASIGKAAFEALPSDKIGVLDFETANGWKQTSRPIRYDQTSVGGQGSPFDYNTATVAPYASWDKLTEVFVADIKGSLGEDLEVSFESALRDTQAITANVGVFRATDNGDGAAGYLVTGGTQGISTTSVYWNGSANVINGVWVTFSSPMQAAGVCTNMGQPTYGRYPKVMWFDANGNQLAAAASPCNVGNSIFWGIQTDVPAIKSMWIGDAGTFPGNYIIDNIAFYAPPVRYRGFTAGSLDHGILEEAVVTWNANQVRYMLSPGTFKEAINAPSLMDAWNQMLVDLPAQLDDARALGLAVVLDLHQLPEDNPEIYSTDPTQNSHLWWYDQDNLDLMIDCWKQLATLCKDRDQVIWFDLFNEPLDWTVVGSTPSYPPTWPTWAQTLINEIRAIDTRHPIVVESGPGSLCWGFNGFPLLSDSYQEVIYSVHVYQPQEYTHQGVQNQTILGWPGTWGNGINQLKSEYAAARAYQLQYGVQIWVGEFSVARWSPGGADYLQDCIDMFEEYGWDWNYHALGGGVWGLGESNEVDLYDQNGIYVRTGLAQVGLGLFYAPFGTAVVGQPAAPVGFTDRGAVVKAGLDENAPMPIPLWTHTLHGIPGGNFSTLGSLSQNCSLGWWGNHVGAGCSASLVWNGTSSRHCELYVNGFNQTVSVWYIDSLSTPLDMIWRVRCDLSWSGGMNGGTSKYFTLLPGQDPNGTPVFSLRFYGYNIQWTTPTASGTYTSATGLDSTYRQVSIQYNPQTGSIEATLGDETIFSGTTTTGLTVQAVRLNSIFRTTYDPGILSIDNLTAWTQSIQLTQSIPGDANGDGMVDVGDLGILAANYGGSGKSWGQGDFNGDGWVDVGDLGILAANYGTNAGRADWATDYANAFGTTVAEENTDDEETASSVCSGLGLPLIAGLAMMGLMLVKWEE